MQEDLFMRIQEVSKKLMRICIRKKLCMDLSIALVPKLIYLLIPFFMNFRQFPHIRDRG